MSKQPSRPKRICITLTPDQIDQIRALMDNETALDGDIVHRWITQTLRGLKSDVVFAEVNHQIQVDKQQAYCRDMLIRHPERARLLQNPGLYL